MGWEGGVIFQEEGREWRLPGLLYADNLVLCDELEEGLRAMVGCFAELYRRFESQCRYYYNNIIIIR